MIKEFTIIVSILAIAYMLEIGLGLPMPASIIGMLILLLLLLTKVIKLRQVERASDLLQKEITLFLIPLSIGIIESIDLFEGKFLIAIVVVAVSTAISIFTTALIMKIIMRTRSMNKGEKF